MLPHAPTTAPAELRWDRLAEARGLAPGAPVCLALSGGADSVFLLHLLAAAKPRPEVLAIHVDHGWRGDESASDARFCAALCAKLSVPFQLVQLDLDPAAPSAEAVARRARYEALARAAEAHGVSTLLTAHHADDRLETFLFRWTRGTRAPGLYGPRASTAAPLPTSGPLRIVRPLDGLRSATLRAWLRQHGHTWREDPTNADPAHTRSRVRHGLLPLFDAWQLEELLPGFERFAAAARELEDELEEATAQLAWRPLATPASAPDLGTLCLERAPLMELPRALLRRVLWRLVHEASGGSMRRAPLEALVADVAAGRVGRMALPRRATMELRADELRFLPAADHDAVSAEVSPVSLAVPGSVTLADGRRLEATLEEPDTAPKELQTSDERVVLDADHAGRQLLVRLPRPGDRYHALGAPGSKPVTRFLADRGRPRAERPQSLLVWDELEDRQALWIPGFPPAHRARLRDTTTRRLVLELHPARGDFPQHHG